MHFKWGVDYRSGNAGSWCDGKLPATLTKTTVPVHGDLIVFAPGSCGADTTTGHIAVVDVVNAAGDSVTLVEQNRAGRRSSKVSCALCFLHAVANNGSSSGGTGGSGSGGAGGSAGSSAAAGNGTGGAAGTAATGGAPSQPSGGVSAESGSSAGGGAPTSTAGTGSLRADRLQRPLRERRGPVPMLAARRHSRARLPMLQTAPAAAHGRAHLPPRRSSRMRLSWLDSWPAEVC